LLVSTLLGMESFVLPFLLVDQRGQSQPALVE